MRQIVDHAMKICHKIFYLRLAACVLALCALFHFGFLLAADSALPEQMKEGVVIGLLFGVLISVVFATVAYLNDNFSVEKCPSILNTGLRYGFPYGAVVFVLNLFTYGWTIAAVSGVISGFTVGMFAALVLLVAKEREGRKKPES